MNISKKLGLNFIILIFTWCFSASSLSESHHTGGNDHAQEQPKSREKRGAKDVISRIYGVFVRDKGKYENNFKTDRQKDNLDGIKKKLSKKGLPFMDQNRDGVSYIPRKKQTTPETVLPGSKGEYEDTYDNIWKKGPPRGRNGDTFEWDVTLSKKGKRVLKDAKVPSNSIKNHINVSKDGKITH